MFHSQKEHSKQANSNEIDLFDVPTRVKPYRFIKIEFDDLPPETELSVIQKYRNVRLTWYCSTMSLFLFIATIITAGFYLRKITKQDFRLAEVHYLTSVGLCLQLLFNTPYKIAYHENTFTAALDGVLNALMISFVFLCSLVVMHAFMGK